MVETLSIGKKINEWRKEKGMTLNQLAENTNLFNTSKKVVINGICLKCQKK